MTCISARHCMGLALLFAGAMGTSAFAQSAPVTDVSVAVAAAPHDQTGVATWYGADYDGRPTASGELFDMYRLTAASPTLPLNSVVEVTNTTNGRVVQVVINDRRDPGPGGVIVLSKAAAANLGFVTDGSAQVSIRKVSRQALAAPSAPRPLPRVQAADASMSEHQMFWSSSQFANRAPDSLLVWGPVEIACR